MRRINSPLNAVAQIYSAQAIKIGCGAIYSSRDYFNGYVTLNIKKDKEVQLIGFGSFKVSRRAARNGINPRTKEPIRIRASRTVKFKAGAGLKKIA